MWSLTGFIGLRKKPNGLKRLDMLVYSSYLRNDENYTDEKR